MICASTLCVCLIIFLKTSQLLAAHGICYLEMTGSDSPSSAHPHSGAGREKGPPEPAPPLPLLSFAVGSGVTGNPSAHLQGVFGGAGSWHWENSEGLKDDVSRSCEGFTRDLSGPMCPCPQPLWHPCPVLLLTVLPMAGWHGESGHGLSTEHPSVWPLTGSTLFLSR